MISNNEIDKKNFDLNGKIDLTPHTVFLLCGPTQCGKSTFASNLSYLAERMELTSTVISSDEIRKSLLEISQVSTLGKVARYSDGMGAVSKQAFDILNAHLKASVSFPINTEVVVVDTTGMDKNFRNEVKKIAEDNGYRIVLVTFEYKFRSDYLTNLREEDASKYIVEKSVLRYRTKVLTELGSKDFPNRLRIRSRSSFGPDSSISLVTSRTEAEAFLTPESKNAIELLQDCNNLNYKRENLSYVRAFERDPVWAVIGDSHECVAELKELVTTLEGNYPGVRLVHIGDYLDKGKNTIKMVDYMYERLGLGDVIIQGNHESYVAKRLLKEIGSNKELEENFFTSISILEGNAGAREKFLTIWKSSKSFAILCDNDFNGGSSVYVTHAPCSNRNLGKVSNFALKAQRNYRIEDRSKPMVEELDWFYKEANFSHPLHIFGHVAHKVTEAKGYWFKNKIFLDSGAVHGGKLSAVVIKGGRVVNFVSVFVKDAKIEEPLTVENLGFGPKQTGTFDILDYDLDPRDLRLLDQVMEKNVRYISGTMAPAPSSNDSIEPLRGALEWFKKLGVTTVCLQPKYMGSRCQMYLFKDSPEKTFAVSRKGWVINRISGLDDAGLKNFLVETWKKYERLLTEYGDMIIDGELLPWHALGEGLINDTFVPYKELVSNELKILNEDAGFKDLVEFTPEFKLDEKLIHVSKFEKELKKYAKPEKPNFVGFDILSCEHTENLPRSSYGRFSLVNNFENTIQVSLDLGDDEFEARLKMAQNWFENLTTELGMEGVVVKPFDTSECDLPYMKVRSEEYLRLVYGYDYLDSNRYAKLVRQKNISNKVRLSIQEHKAAIKMLNASGDEKKEIVVKLISQIKEETTLDPRL